MASELHLLSGGIDSASILLRRLKETDNHIHVLHLNRDGLKFVAALGAMELKAARAVAVWLASNTRMFEYHEATPLLLGDKPCANGVSAMCGFAAGEYVVRNSFIGTVVQGNMASPEDQSPESLFRRTYKEAVCHAVCHGYAPLPAWVYPHNEIMKVEAYKYMPEELQCLCWSCTQPQLKGEIYVPCQVCEKCLQVKAVREIM